MFLIQNINNKRKRNKPATFVSELILKLCGFTFLQTVGLCWMILFPFFFFFTPFFGFACVMQKFPAQEVNLHHHCDKARSLIS